MLYDFACLENRDRGYEGYLLEMSTMIPGTAVRATVHPDHCDQLC